MGLPCLTLAPGFYSKSPKPPDFSSEEQLPALQPLPVPAAHCRGSAFPRPSRAAPAAMPPLWDGAGGGEGGGSPCWFRPLSLPCPAASQSGPWPAGLEGPAVRLGRGSREGRNRGEAGSSRLWGPSASGMSPAAGPSARC